MMYGGWPEGRVVLVCWIGTKFPLLLYFMLFTFFTAIGALDYHRRYEVPCPPLIAHHSYNAQLFHSIENFTVLLSLEATHCASP